jgi:hypothetical protein
MTTTVLHDDIRAFAAAVRGHLDDLPVDDVEELIDGLEADMTEQAADARGDFVLPDAAAYAAELRSAAGLPARDAKASHRRHGTASWRGRARAARTVVAEWIARHPAARSVCDFLVSLRPVWWIIRALVAYALVLPLIPPFTYDVSEFVKRFLASITFMPQLTVLLGALIVVSIQWGRGRWMPWRWVRVLCTTVSLIAAIAAPFMVFAVASETGSAYGRLQSAAEVPDFTPGLAVDGGRVRNIFAYDSAGNPLKDVQLFDQDGRPLTTVGGGGANADMDYYFYGGGGPTPVAVEIPGRQPVWNVFPLREMPPGVWDDQDPATDASFPAVPFAQVPPLPLAQSTDAGGTSPDTTSIVPTPAPAP